MSNSSVNDPNTSVSSASDDNFIEALQSKKTLPDLTNQMSKLKLSSRMTQYLSQCLLDRKNNKNICDVIFKKLEINSLSSDRWQSIMDKLDKIQSHNDKVVEKTKVTQFLKYLRFRKFSEAKQKYYEMLDPSSEIGKYIEDTQAVYQSSKNIFDYVFKTTSKLNYQPEFENVGQSLEQVLVELVRRDSQLEDLLKQFEKLEVIKKEVQYKPNTNFSFKLPLWIHALKLIEKRIVNYQKVKESYENIMTSYFSTKRAYKSKIIFQVSQWYKQVEAVQIGVIEKIRMKNVLDVQIQSYQNQIKRIFQAVQSKQNELLVLRRQLESNNGTMNNTKNNHEIVTLKKQLETQKKNICQNKKFQTQLLSQKEKLEKQLQKEQIKNKDYETALGNIQLHNKKTVQKIAKEKEEQERKCENLNKQKEGLSKVNKELNEINQKLRKQLEKEKKRKQTQSHQHLATIKERQKQLTSLLQAKKKTLQMVNSERQQLDNQLKKAKQNFAKDLCLKEDMLKRVKANVEQLQQQLSSHRQKNIQDLNRQNQLQKQHNERSITNQNTIRILQQQIQKLIQEHRLKTDTLTQQLDQLRIQNQQKGTKIDQMQEQIREINFDFQREKANLEQQFKAEQQEKVRLAQELNLERQSKERLISLNSAKQQELTSKIGILESEMNKLSVVTSQLQNAKTALEREVSLIKEEKTTLEREISGIKEEKTALEREVSGIKEEKAVLDKEMSGVKAEKAVFQTEISSIREDMRALERENNNLKEHIQSLESKSGLELSSVSKIHLSFYEQKATENQQLKLDPITLSMIDRFFQGSVLSNRFEDKDFLISSLQSFMEKTVAKTNLVFTYDPRNKTSFHEYIDNKSNLLCVVKSEKGVFMATYYSGAYKENTIMNEPALLISLKDKELFKLNAPREKLIPRGMVNDKFYIIFGNSELRLKLSDREIYSNFSVNNAYFNNRGFTVDTLLGEGKNRTTTLESLEFYEIVFMEEERKTEEKPQ